MQNALLRMLLSLVTIIVNLPVILQAQVPYLSQFNKVSNMGQEFYFSFPPCYQTASANNFIKLYVASPVRASVTVEIPGKGFTQTKFTIPNDVIEFTLSPSIAQPFEKPASDAAPTEQTYPQAAIHVTADAPVIVYGVSRFVYTSDSFLALPTEALGKKYIISSMGDMSAMYPGMNLPSETTVSAVEDNTQITFTVGGNADTKTVGGLSPGQSVTATLNRGDVWAVANNGSNGDLSGSTIESNKPIAVVSGNQCANVPVSNRWCDYIVEMETPEQTWGKVYLVPNIPIRKNSPLLRIYAKEANATIERDGQAWKNIMTAGGVLDTGFISERTYPQGNKVAAITSNKRINCVLYNPGQEEDNISSDPFQMNILPIEQFCNELIFCTPGIRGGLGFLRNNVAVVYPLDGGNGIPDDLEFGVRDGDSVLWRKLSVVFGVATGDVFAGQYNGHTYAVKTCVLPSDGVYLLRCNAPIGAYSYGFSDYDSYGMPAGGLQIDYGTIANGGGHPPVPIIVSSKGSSTEGTVSKEDNANENSIAKVQLGFNSTNYKLTTGKISLMSTFSTTWRLDVQDVAKPAKAYLTFTDRAGNDTTIQVAYSPVTGVEPSVSPAEEIAMRVYPNPLASESLLEYDAAQPSTIQVVSINGVVLLSYSVSETGHIKRTLPFATVAKGAYFIKVQMGAKEFTRSVVKE